VTGQELDEICRKIGSRWVAFSQADDAA